MEAVQPEEAGHLGSDPELERYPHYHYHYVDR